MSATFTLEQIGAMLEMLDRGIADLERDVETGCHPAAVDECAATIAAAEAGREILRDLTVTVRIENHAPSGTESVVAMVLAPNGGAPLDLETLLRLDEWWEDHVFPRTGGNGATVIEATVDRAADVALIGRTYVWEG